MSSVMNSSTLSLDYMTLLTAQLQNQNPLEPMSNDELTAQLTRLSQLEQTEELNTSFSEVLEITQQNQATNLIGRTVSFVGENASGNVEVMTGKVDHVVKDGDGKPLIGIGNYALTLDDILTVKE